jgi:hypothetical protein
MALGTFWMIDIVIAVASALVLVGLLYIYATNYRSLRSPFALGLVVFASLFLLENLAAMYFYMAMADSNVGASVALPMLVLNAAELVGFSTLFYVSWR